MSFYFDIDEMLVGPGCVIFVQGHRRRLVRGLGDEQLAWLREVSKQDCFSIPPAFSPLAQRLASHDIVRTGARPVPQLRTASLRIPGSVVRVAALPLMPLTHPLVGLAALLGIAVSVMAGIIPVETRLSAHYLFDNADALFLGGLFAWLIILSLVHEMGHAAACQRVTRMVGRIRLGIDRGMAVMATDVSAIALADKSGKAAVALSGITCQCVASVGVLLFSSSTPVRFAATVSLLSAAFCILPFPRNDGYWLIRDYFGVALVPRLFWRSSASRWEGLYGWFLLVFTLLISFAVLRAGTEPFAHASDYITKAPMRASVMYAILLYMDLVIIGFLTENLRLIFHAPMCAARQSDAA